MKKQHKTYNNIKLNNDKLDKTNQKISLKSDTNIDSSFNINRNKNNMFSSPNKQNQFMTANQQKETPFSPLSPVHNHFVNCPSSPPQNPQHFFQSPTRTTSSESLDALRSNKGKQIIKQEPFSKILFSGLSKDGRYKVQSHSLEGEELAKAVEQEKKLNLSNIMQAQKDKNGIKFQPFAPARISNKYNGVIKSYAVNTHQGISRGYNQDRVSITLNIKKNGIKTHFFAIYDGHGGSLCCDFLKDSLHQLLINSPHFPNDPKKALTESINLAEQKFMHHAKINKSKDMFIDRSGSCIIMALIVDDICYVANVGDSRAILSTEGGKYAFNLSRDHRPTDVREQQRILSMGGKIYRTEMTKIQEKGKDDKIVGPLRIYPGKLSVSRTIGDIESKLPELGGIRNVISSQAEIRKFRLSGKQDFVVLCCDGILERMESMQVIELAWKQLKGQGSMHEKAGRAVDRLIIESMQRRSSDNLTVIIICFGELNEENYRSPKKLNTSPRAIIS